MSSIVNYIPMDNLHSYWSLLIITLIYSNGVYPTVKGLLWINALPNFVLPSITLFLRNDRKFDINFYYPLSDP